jgi:rsbT co-antagonist protein RsbR
MHADLHHVGDVWRAQRATSIAQLTDDILAHAGPAYASNTRDQMVSTSTQLIDAWQAAFDSGDSAPIQAFAQALGRRGAEDHVGVDVFMTVIDLVRDLVWRVLDQVYASGECDRAVVAELERWLHAMRNSAVSSYGETFRMAEQRLDEREHALSMQRQLIQELSTPIVPIHEGVLVLPLVGTIDTRRAMQIVESVLEQIVEHQADVFILDITGVAVVDTSVGNHILQMTRAVRLLGATTVLVGISSEIAQTLVQLGVDLSSISIKANLQAGIAYALSRCGLAIQPIQDDLVAV